MRSLSHLAPALVGALTLAACAGGPPPEAYPGLAIRDVERVSGMLPPPEPPPPPAPPSPAQLAELAELAGTARRAHQAFLAAEPAARRTISAARGAATGSEGWAQAQLALARLQAHRSQTFVPLADLDRLYVDAVTADEASPALAAAQGEVAALVAEESRTITELEDMLRR